MTAQTSAPQVELLPCPLCHSSNVAPGVCYVDFRPNEPAARCVDCGCRATLKAWNTRPSPDSEGVKAAIRQLDWQETFCDRGDGSQDSSGWEADSGFGPWYIIEMCFGSDSYGWTVDYDASKIGDVDDPDKAKEIAQTDFERRVGNALSIPPQASAGERGWTAPTLPPVPIDWARPVGATFDEMRDNVWKSGLASKGDTILVWVNEGDFWHALMVCGGKEFAPPATLEPGRGK